MNVKIKAFDTVKYSKDARKIAEVICEIDSCELITGEKAEALEAEENVKADERDDFHEYLRLTFADGTESLYRNSYVDVYRI